MGKYYIGHLSYNGENYFGWQKQPNVPTIQDTIFQTIRSLYEFGRIDVKATSRTDRGVHAFSQVVKFLVPRKEDPEVVREKLNQALPKDLYFHQVERINKSFKVTYLAEFKEYLYFFDIKDNLQNSSFIVSKNQFDEDKSGSLSIDLMKEAALLYRGKHFFGHYQNKSDAKGDFEREIYDSKILHVREFFPESQFFSSNEFDNTYVFYCKGQGFLKQMVRMMMGALVKIGRQEITNEYLSQSLIASESFFKKDLNFIAPAKGLFLYRISFPEHEVGGERRQVLDKRSCLHIFENMNLWVQ